MTAIYSLAAEELFRAVQAERALGRDVSITMAFLEVTDSGCKDLYGAGRDVKLIDGIATGCCELEIGSVDDMLSFIGFGLKVRRTEETGVHAASSRSHSMLQVYVKRGPPAPSEGCLVLVDLAGSEQAIDSAYHNAQRQREGAAINTSLMALKSCILARAAGKESLYLSPAYCSFFCCALAQAMAIFYFTNSQIRLRRFRSGEHMFRKSVLTMALKPSFTSKNAATVVIATASPAAKDTEHTLNSPSPQIITHKHSKVRNSVASS